MGNTGKIARLPQRIRNILNTRIEDGEPGNKLVAWLNSLDVVKEVLDEYFDGRLITEQNLSEWKERGYKASLEHQQSRELAREFLAEAEELEEEMGETSFTDRISETVALALAKLLRETLREEKGPEQRKAVLEIAREIGCLRRGDHQMERVNVMRERWEAEQEEEEEEHRELEELEEKTRLAKEWSRGSADILWEEYKSKLKKGGMTAESRARLEAFFAKSPEYFPEFAKKPRGASGGRKVQAKSG